MVTYLWLSTKKRWPFWHLFPSMCLKVIYYTGKVILYYNSSAYVHCTLGFYHVYCSRLTFQVFGFPWPIDLFSSILLRSFRALEKPLRHSVQWDSSMKNEWYFCIHSNRTTQCKIRMLMILMNTWYTIYSNIFLKLHPVSGIMRTGCCKNKNSQLKILAALTLHYYTR